MNRIGLTLRRRDDVAPGLLYVPEPFQRDVHRSTARYNALLGSPGLGKTILGAQETVRWIRDGVGNGLILAPTYGTAYQVDLHEFRKWAPRGLSIPRSHQTNWMDLGGGRTIFIRSAEHPEAIDGLTDITFVWIDEGDLIEEHVWLRVRERLDRQSSHGSPIRRVVVTATPQLVKGKSWLRDLFWKPYTDGNPDVFCRRATVWESTRVTEEMKASIERENPPGTWTRARYDAEWAPIVEGLVYPELPRMKDPLWAFQESEEAICGVDCGTSDPFVLLVLGRRLDKWCIFGEVRVRNAYGDDIARRVATLLRHLDPRNRFGWLVGHVADPFTGALLTHAPSRMAIPTYHDHDPTQVDEVDRRLREEHGIHLGWCRADKRNKRKSIDHVRGMMIRNEVIFTSGASDTWHEHAAYAWLGRGKPDATTHDTSHGPDALRYALFTHTGPSRQPALHHAIL